MLLHDLSLVDISPQYLLDDTNVKAVIHSLDPELQEITGEIKNVLLYSRIDDLDEQTLNLLAWQFHIDDFDLSLGASAATLDMKREAVKNAILLHMKKGTQWAITEALRQLEVNAEFIPWWQDDAEPYTFKINAEITGDFYITQRQDRIVSSIVRAINSNKSPRSYLSKLNITLNDKLDMTHYLAVFPFIGGNGVISLLYPNLTEHCITIADCVLLINGQLQIPEKYDDLIELSSVKNEIIMFQYFVFVIGADNFA